MSRAPMLAPPRQLPAVARRGFHSKKHLEPGYGFRRQEVELSAAIALSTAQLESAESAEHFFFSGVSRYPDL